LARAPSVRTGIKAMMNWFQRLLPREDKFFDLFESHAQTLVAGADALRQLLDGGEDAARFGKIVVEKESEADRITQAVMQSVRRTFITPFDRSDIQELIQSMDDAIDQMHQTVKTITLFEVREFDPLMRDLADLAIDAAAITLRAVPLLREIAAHAGEINAYAVAMTQLEERSDQMHDEGIRNLFRRHRTSDPMAFIVGSEVYAGGQPGQRHRDRTSLSAVENERHPCYAAADRPDRHRATVRLPQRAE
jgi:uncharacterized protein Yka (UPF0111/DUF47 family)